MDPLKAIRMALLVAKSVAPAVEKPLMRKDGGDVERKKNLSKFMEGAHPSVLNEDGTPKVFYHGTKRDFSDFKPAYSDNLIFFTTNPQFASKWPVGTGGLREPSPESKEEMGRLRALQKHIESVVPRPKDDSDEEGSRYLKDVRDEFKKRSGFRSPYDYEEHAGTRVMPVHISAKNPFNPKKDWAKIEPFLSKHPKLHGLVSGGHHKSGNWLVYEDKDVINKLKEMGHDAVWLAEDTGGPLETLAAFNPTQVKSATGNRGTYDPQEADITKAGGGEVDSDLETAKRLGMDTSSIPEVRRAGQLRDFGQSLGERVRSRADEAARLAKDYHESGKLPFPVGTRFTTEHSRKNGLPPFKVLGHYVDTKNPEHYGYHTEQGKEGEEGHIRQMIAVNDPEGDYRRTKLFGHKPFDRKAYWDNVQVLGGLTRVKAAGGIVTDPQKAIRKALMMARGMSRGGQPKFEIMPPKPSVTSPENFTPYDSSRPTMLSLGKAFDEAIAHHLSLSPEERIANSQRAAKAVADHIGRTSNGKPKDLLGKNAKLLKTEKGKEESIQIPDGRGVETTGLALAPAYEQGNFKTCPNSQSCKAECLGKTSGNYFKLGGGTDLSQFKGPRLNSLLKTFAFLKDPHSFAVKLHDEIQAAKDMAAANGNHLGVRLNVLSDINPRVHRAIIKAHPDVTFYDYTKNNTDPIAPNHHYTYSSTGLTQPGVENQNSNWKHMRKRLNDGDNVAMAFSHKDHLPEFVHDQETGKKYKVIDGDTHDFRPLDVQPEGADGVIIGLRNKKATGTVADAHRESNGFFVHYDPQLKMAKNSKGKPIYERTASTQISPKTGKPMLGDTIPQNRVVNILPQDKSVQTLSNDGAMT